MQGLYGAIYFLSDQDLECDVGSVDKNKILKTKFVIKKQSRKFSMGSKLDTKDRCLSFKGIGFFLAKTI